MTRNLAPEDQVWINRLDGVGGKVSRLWALELEFILNNCHLRGSKLLKKWFLEPNCSDFQL